MINKIYNAFDVINGFAVVLKYIEAYNSCLQDPRNTFTCIRGSMDSLCDLLGKSKNVRYKDETHIQDKLVDLRERGIDAKSIDHLQAIKVICNDAAHLRDLKFVPDTNNAIKKLNEYHNLLFAISMKYLGIKEKIEFVKPDSSTRERLHLYRNAIENSDPESLYLTAMHIEKTYKQINVVMSLDPEEIKRHDLLVEHAKHFYKQSALHVNSPYTHKALYKLALIYIKESKSFYSCNNQPDETEKIGFTYLSQSADLGNSDALNLMGEILVCTPSLHVEGSETYLEKILSSFHKSAEQDNYKALHNLMHYYTYGIWDEVNNKEVLAIDYKKAFDYGWKAAEAGYPNAQYLISEMFRKGQGCQQDLGKAEKWFKTAVARKDIQALVAYFTINKDKVTDKEKVDFLNYLETNDHILSLYFRAMEYYEGKVVKHDYFKAMILLLIVLEHKDFNFVPQLNHDDLTALHMPVELLQLAETELVIRKVIKKYILTIPVHLRPVINKLFEADGYPKELTIKDFPKALKQAENEILDTGKKLDKNRLECTKAIKDIGRNEPCPCGSKIKYKNCHGKNIA